MIDQKAAEPSLRAVQARRSSERTLGGWKLLEVRQIVDRAMAETETQCKCNSRGGCKNRRCGCPKAGRPCGSGCACSNCANPLNGVNSIHCRSARSRIFVRSRISVKPRWRSLCRSPVVIKVFRCVNFSMTSAAQAVRRRIGSPFVGEK